jgi:hypothetical protein
VVKIISPVVYVLQKNGKQFLGHAAYMKLCHTSEIRGTVGGEEFPIETIESTEFRNSADEQDLMGISLEGEVIVRAPVAPAVINPNVNRGPPLRHQSAPREDTGRRELRVQLEDINLRSAGDERYSRRDTPRLRDMLSANFRSRQESHGSSRGEQASAVDQQDVNSPSRMSEDRFDDDQRYPRRETRPPFWQTTKEFLMGSTRTKSANYRRNK